MDIEFFFTDSDKKITSEPRKFLVFKKSKKKSYLIAIGKAETENVQGESHLEILKIVGDKYGEAVSSNRCGGANIIAVNKESRSMPAIMIYGKSDTCGSLSNDLNIEDMIRKLSILLKSIVLFKRRGILAISIKNIHENYLIKLSKHFELTKIIIAANS